MDYLKIFFDNFFTIVILAPAVYLFNFKINHRENFVKRSIIAWIAIVFSVACVSLFLTFVSFGDKLRFLQVALAYVVSIYVILEAIRTCYDCPKMNFYYLSISTLVIYYLCLQFGYMYGQVLMLTAKDAYDFIEKHWMLDLLIKSTMFISIYLVVYFVFGKYFKLFNDLQIEKKLVRVTNLFTVEIFLAMSLLQQIIVDNLPLLIVSSVCCVLFCLGNFLYQVYTAYSINKLAEANTMLTLIKEREKQNAILKESMDVISIKAHDLKHIIEQIKSKNCTDFDFDEACNAVADFQSVIKTGNETLDVILTNRNLICNARKIDFDYKVDGCALDFMRDEDVMSLFANALDNAIEYLSDIDEKDRYITLLVAKKDGFVSISIENFYNGKVKNIEELKTVKSDKINHGFGLKSIKYITEKYGGALTVRTEGNAFVLSACFAL